MTNHYLDRYAWPGPLIEHATQNDTGIIVVIPCFREPDVLDALQALYSCSLPNCSVEVIIVVNHSEAECEDVKQYNIQSANEISSWISQHKKEQLAFQLIRAFDLPKKHAGVGLARKIGMDEAVRRFASIGQKDGIIACYDADCCCEPNYLEAIFDFYAVAPSANAGLIYFEHALTGDLPDHIYNGILNYELHIRYYKNALRYCQFPFSYHTIGSCITVRSEAYQKQGGMNRRKAGEDFYFLQKVFALGSCYDITTTTVYPSPRDSDRVPFGTGRSVGDFIKMPEEHYLTYNPRSFEDLKAFLQIVPNLYECVNCMKLLNTLPLPVYSFLMTTDFPQVLNKINKNSRSQAVFMKAFYRNFDGFYALKFIHYARQNHHREVEVLDAANWLLSKLGVEKRRIKIKNEALDLLRQFDRSGQLE